MIFVDEKHLSARLACVASLVPAGARVADIGSDHAYLPAALVLDGKIDFAIAGEVVKGPYENAVHEIKDHQLEGLKMPERLGRKARLVLHPGRFTVEGQRRREIVAEAHGRTAQTMLARTALGQHEREGRDRHPADEVFGSARRF